MQGKKVLLISPARDTLSIKGRPHLGLGILAGKLKQSGYEVKILDYIIDRALPTAESVIDSFNPDIVGITINTAFWDLADGLLESLSKRPDIIKLVGGPHTTLYWEELAEDGRAHYIFRGESEESILDACGRETPPEKPVIFEPSRPEMDKIPIPAFECCLKNELISEYPLQTSRGCPFGCIFCEVSNISSKRWRPRPIDPIIEEIKIAKDKYPAIKVLEIQDDNPAFDRDRFKEFLSRYMQVRGDWEIRIDNMRADNIDTEVVGLLKDARCLSICLGVEHANPEMFKSVNKGETLEQISSAARIIREGGMQLGFCFVIGLPGDSFEKTKDSVRFVLKNKADYMFWNILAPHKGTKVREWFEKNGRIEDERNFTSLVDDQVFCGRPICDSDSFKREDIVRAHFYAVLATNNYRLTKKNMNYVIKTAAKYGFYKELVKSLAIQFYRKNIAK